MTDDNMKSNKVWLSKQVWLSSVIVHHINSLMLLQFTEDVDYRAVEDDFM